MRTLLITVLSVMLLGCGTYQGGESWRRSICDAEIDPVEKDNCLQDATRPENEYRDDVDKATSG